MRSKDPGTSIVIPDACVGFWDVWRPMGAFGPPVLIQRKTKKDRQTD